MSWVVLPSIACWLITGFFCVKVATGYLELNLTESEDPLFSPVEVLTVCSCVMSPRYDFPLFPVPVSASLSVLTALPFFLPVFPSSRHGHKAKSERRLGKPSHRFTKKCRASFVHADIDNVAPPYEPLEALEWRHLKMLTRDQLPESWSKPELWAKWQKLTQGSSSCIFTWFLCRLLNAAGQTRINQPCVSPRQTLTNHVCPWPGPRKKVSSQNTAQLRLFKSRGNHKRRALAGRSPESEKGKLQRRSRDCLAVGEGWGQSMWRVECLVSAFPDRGGSCWCLCAWQMEAL